MTIFKQLEADWKESRIQQDSFKLTTLGTFLSDMKANITLGMSMSVYGIYNPKDEEVIPHLKSTIKGLKVGLELAESQKGSDETHVVVDYKRKIRAEILLLESYLPQKLSEEELKQIVTNLKVAAGTKTGGALLGFVMGELKKGYPNLYDASLVRSLVETK